MTTPPGQRPHLPVVIHGIKHGGSQWRKGPSRTQRLCLVCMLRLLPLEACSSLAAVAADGTAYLYLTYQRRFDYNGLPLIIQTYAQAPSPDPPPCWTSLVVVGVS